MASYDELFNLGTDTALRNKVAVGVIVKADAISALPTPTQLQLDWAKASYADHIGVAETILLAVLAANKDAAVAAITGATDVAIQNNVDAVVDNIFTKAGA